ncbi:MAG: hypothetical protein EOO29_05070 [Comamonadaceae bacterium]|nr:MAG: hypothetical protein EOO29_05070 [Comamonadaceae bacterium]
MVLGGVWLLSRLPDGEQLARQAETEFERRFGIGLQIGSVQWQWRPVPQLVLRDLRTSQDEPITVEQIVAVPRLQGLWQRQIALAQVEVDGLHLSSAAVRAFRGRETRLDDAPASGGWGLAAVPVARFVFRDLQWRDRRGLELAYDGEVDFDAGWLPRTARVQRPGVTPLTQLQLTRENQPPEAGEQPQRAAWQVRVDAGGGEWLGRAQLRQADGGLLQLQADLDAKGVDVAQLVAAFGRRPAIEGRTSGRTVLQAEGRQVGEMLRSLRTRTDFQMTPATLLRFDLARTVSTLGRERVGQTVLDELRGTLQTQATGEGTRLRYSQLQAKSGVLSASGHLQVFNRRMQGRLAIDLVDGVVGVPLQLGGTLDVPQLGLSSGALTGAAAGTAVMPGVGTAIGARIGQQLQDWFGDEEAAEPARRGVAPAQRARPRD